MDIKLKRLCQKHPLSGLIQQINVELLNNSLCIFDHLDQTILGTPDETIAKYPILVGQDQLIGFVSGLGNVEIIADLISYAVQNELQSKALAQDTLSKYKELSLLYELSEKVAACVETNQLTALALSETRRLISSAGLSVVIALIGTENQSLTVHASDGSQFCKGQRFEQIDGITESVILNGVSEIVIDVSKDERFNNRPDILANVASLLCTALKGTDRVYGVILIVSEQSYPFQAADLKVLNVLASQIGMAIGRAELISNLVEQELLQESLKLSRDIQMGMLSTNFPTHKTNTAIDLFAYIQPAKDVGGDFYDFFYLNPTTLLIAVADVSGKGVPAALFMVMAKTLLRVVAKQESRPDRILKTLNAELCQDNDSAMFVTFFIATLNTVTGELIFSNGGHNPPVILRNNGAITYLEGETGTALGILDFIDFTQQAIQFNPGDSIVLYTDGVTEAMSVDYELFNEERFVESLLKCHLDTAEELSRKVLNALTSYTVGAEQSDDITLLAVRLLALDSV